MSILKDQLQENKAFQMIIEDLSVKIQGIELRLIDESSDTLPDKARDRLIDKKELYQWFLGLFTDTEVNVIAEKVKENQEYYNKNYR